MEGTLNNKPNLWSHVVCLAAFFFSADFQKTIVFGKDINVVSYLSQFGYLPPEYKNPKVGNLISEDTLNSALVDFQTFNGLEATGIVDDATLKLMRTPRCGVADRFYRDPNSEDYVLGDPYFRWNKTTLTYYITNYSRHRNITYAAVRKVVVEVFAVWSYYTPLEFIEGSNKFVDIPITFLTGNHGDKNPFDGPSQVLAHAFYPGPGLGGDAHFDDDESWYIYRETVQWNRRNYMHRVELATVALHEFGHALGLNHSSVTTAVMYAYYSGGNTHLRLDQDDINGIQALYGVRVRVTTGTRNNTTGTRNNTTGTRNNTTWTRNNTTWIYNVPTRRIFVTRQPTNRYSELCNQTQRKYTIFMDVDRRTYLLSGPRYWIINDFNMSKPQSYLIRQKWVYLRGYVDAAFVYGSYTYFFTGQYVWAYSNNWLARGFPALIRSAFQGLPNNIDTALAWQGWVYIFKGQKYWKYQYYYDSKYRYGYFKLANNSYPQTINRWSPELPPKIDSAMLYSNGYQYFFKGNQYWRYNWQGARIDNDWQPFPRPVDTWWLLCTSDGRRPRGTL